MNFSYWYLKVWLGIHSRAELDIMDIIIKISKWGLMYFQNTKRTILTKEKILYNIHCARVGHFSL